jgi:hypothetical protein
MPKRSSKDINQLAQSLVAQATAETLPVKTKNQAAVALGRLGGIKGGKARAAKLSLAKRREIAKNAASIRWAKTK